MKKNRVSRRKSRRNKGGHLLGGVGYSLTKTTFDNGCGGHDKRQPTRASRNNQAIVDSMC